METATAGVRVRLHVRVGCIVATRGFAAVPGPDAISGMTARPPRRLGGRSVFGQPGCVRRGPAVDALLIRVRHDPLVPQATVGLRSSAEKLAAGARTPRIAWTIRQTVRTE